MITVARTDETSYVLLAFEIHCVIKSLQNFSGKLLNQKATIIQALLILDYWTSKCRL